MRGCAGQDDCGDICVLEYLISFHLLDFKVQLALRRFSALRSEGRHWMPRDIRLEAEAQSRDSTHFISENFSLVEHIRGQRKW